MARIDTKVAKLEHRSVDVMLDYLNAEQPTDLEADRAKLGLGAFASVQRRLSAHNQREALEMMAQRERLLPPLSPSARSELTAGS